MDLKQNNLTKKALKVSAGALATLSILSNSAFALSPRDIVKKAKSLVAPTVAAVATTAAAASVIGVTGVLVWKLIDLKGEEVEVPIDINDLVNKIDLTTREKMLESFKSVGEYLRLKEKEGFKRSYASLEENVKEDDYESKFKETYKEKFLGCMGLALGVQPLTDNSDNRTPSNGERILNCIKSAIEEGKINVPNKPQSMGEQQSEENKGALEVNKEESVVQPDPASQSVEVKDEETKAKAEILDVTTGENEAEEENTQATEENEEKGAAPATVEDESKQEADAKPEEEQEVASNADEEKKTEKLPAEKAPEAEENTASVKDQAELEDFFKKVELTEEEVKNVNAALKGFKEGIEEEIGRISKKTKKLKINNIRYNLFNITKNCENGLLSIGKNGYIIRLLDVMISIIKKDSNRLSKDMLDKVVSGKYRRKSFEGDLNELRSNKDLIGKMINIFDNLKNGSITIDNAMTDLCKISGNSMDNDDGSIKGSICSAIKSICRLLEAYRLNLGIQKK